MRPPRIHTLALLSAVLVSGNMAPAAEAGSWRPRLGIEGGVGLGHLNSSWAIGPKMDSKFGASAGLVARWDLAPGWRFEFAPEWQQVSASGTQLTAFFVDDGSGTIAFYQSNSKKDFRFDRITLPMRAARRLGGSGAFLEVGLAPNWMARAQERFDLELESFATVDALELARPRAEITANIFEDRSNWWDASAAFHRWDVSALAGLGWEFPVGARSIHVRGFWQQGLTDAGKYPDPVRVSAAALTLGVLW